MNTDLIHYTDFSFLDSQVDLILDSLQLYAFNFHKVWGVDYDNNSIDLRNALLFHTYEEILSKYNNNKINYDVVGICRLHYKREKKYQYYKNKKIA